MCGITGIVAPPDARVDPAVLQDMTDRLAHRGPDGAGMLAAWSVEGGFRHHWSAHTREWPGPEAIRVGLGHRRLAILDLSDRGIQPMSPPGDRDTWIVFNGEIYNHRELRAELEAAGFPFRTGTDTEVLLQAYRHWGEGCLSRLEGMYAFAIWDARRHRLFCARDRLGIKPFYYYHGRGWFVFASEIKALFAHPVVPRQADDDAVVAFLVHTNCDYGERTVFREVHALPPAHQASFDACSGRLDVARYWTLEAARLNGAADQARVSGLRDLLLDATRKHLISDVRAGSCLSGGLDSSTVVSLLAEVRREQPDAATALGDQLYTFTSCWNYAEFDEREYALAVTDAVNAKAHLVFPSAQDFWANFGRMAWHQDMPFASFSYYAQWRVMQAARESGVKVLLDGQGGDEVFGGYAKFRYAYLASLLKRGRLATFAREAGATFMQGDFYVLNLRGGYRYLPGSLRRLLGADSLLRSVLRTDWTAAVGGESTPATRWWRYATRAAGGASTASLMQRVQIDDIVSDTLPQLLRMEDRSSMAFSLEARVPLLDHRVVEYGISLPDHLKFHGGWSKYAVRQAMQGLMPERVRQRTTKLGFAAPERAWLLGELRPQITALIEEPLQSERYVNVDALRTWYRASATRPGRANTEACLGLFRVLALEMWMRAFDLSA